MTNASGISFKKKGAHQSGRELVGMQVASVLDKSGREFWEWVQEIENSLVFQKLHQPTLNNGVISIHPIKNYFTQALLAPSCQVNPSAIRTVLRGYPGIYNIYGRMGLNLFYYYFIERRGTNAEKAEFLKWSYSETETAGRTIWEQVTTAENLRRAFGIDSDNGRDKAEVVAEVLFTDGQPVISYTYLQQRYTILEDNLYPIMSEGVLNPDEIKNFYLLRRKMGSINARFKLVNRLVDYVVEHQKAYLARGREEEDLVVLEEQTAARSLGIHPSWISRLIKNKFLIVREKMVSLKELFLAERNLNKKRGKVFLRTILQKQNQRLSDKKLSRPYSDEEIHRLMKSKFNFEISRRTINNWRRELEREYGDGTNEHMG